MATGKNRYSPYALLVDDLHRLMKKLEKQNHVKTPKKERTYKRTLQTLFKLQPDIVKTMDMIIMAEEYLWLNSGCSVIFPHSEEVFDKLLRAKMELKSAAAMNMPHECFTLAMPKNYTFNGQPIPGLLVTWTSRQGRDKLVGDFTQMMTGRRFEREDEYNAEYVLCINYRMPDKYVKLRGGEEDAVGAFRMCIPADLIPELLRQTNAEDFNNILGTFDNKYNGSMGLMADEKELQWHIAKLVMMVGVYSHSFPQALTPGYPGTPPAQMVPKLHPRWNNQGLRLASEHVNHDSDEREYHYRSWYFRQLMDKKYYQGEHKEKPIGSRVVFVRDAMVGRQVDPETLS